MTCIDLDNVILYRGDIFGPTGLIMLSFKGSENAGECFKLHGPSIFADKTKIYGVLEYMRSSFEETSS